MNNEQFRLNLKDLRKEIRKKQMQENYLGKGMNMNIIEAVKSGKKFKREGEGAVMYRFPGYQGERSLTDQDILADDWEIEEEKITISMTKSEFIDILYGQIFSTGDWQTIVENIAKKMGFK